MPVSTDSSSTSGKKIIYDNQDYETNIGMVQLYPNGSSPQSSIEYPTIALANQSGMRLEFDLLQKNADYVNVRMIHCTSDWKESNLNDIQFLKEYNEFAVNEYDFSQNTRTQYVKYGVNLPTPIKSGNYLLIANRDSDQSDLLFTRRFLVYDNRARIQSSIRSSNIVSKRELNQQIEFGIYFEGIENINPLNDIKVVILQNHNWNTMIDDLKPTRIRQDEGFMEYQHFNSENNFPAWNEFRFFDIRSTEFRGRNVSNIRMEDSRVQAFLGLDRSRNNLAYSQQLNDDLNGGYYLQNTDPNDSQLESEYIETHFELNSERVDGEVYIVGRYNNWQLAEANKMVYDQALGGYKGRLLLKQGYYDYMYWTDAPDLPVTYMEGSHYQTINDYEILVYFRSPFNNYEELVGYQLTSSRNQF
ncbi:type IX secretion system plug protein domain-containing protein [Marinoscillum sp.]|uniref:type IX secretion system plug protein n=1 Tax=Marinoscillum sp. TaxID=2024838 RepID=UPI003BA8480B